MEPSAHPPSHQERSQPFPHTIPITARCFPTSSPQCLQSSMAGADGHQSFVPCPYMPCLSLPAGTVPRHSCPSQLPACFPARLPAAVTEWDPQARPSPASHPQAPPALLAPARSQGPVDTTCFFPFLPNNHHLVSQFIPQSQISPWLPSHILGTILPALLRLLLCPPSPVRCLQTSAPAH